MNQEEIKERNNILHRYLENPFCDDSDLYYNGLIDSTEFLDHKPDKLYKLSVVCSLFSKWGKEKELPKDLIKKAVVPLLDHVPRGKRSRKATADCVGNTLKTPNQAELIPSSKVPSKTSLRLTFKFSENHIVCVPKINDVTDIPKHPLETKHAKKTHEDDGNRKKIKNDVFQAPGQPLMDKNSPAKLMSNLQKSDAILVNNLTDTILGNKENRLAIPEIRITKSDILSQKKLISVQRTVNFTYIPPTPLGQKRSRNKDEHEVTRKKTKNNEFQCPEKLRAEKIIPDKLKSHLQSNDAVLVIKKNLTSTDVNGGNNRLAMPQGQMTNPNFLTEEELKGLARKPGEKPPHLPVRLIDPSGYECGINLTKWYMGNNVIYNLISPWKEFVARNNLHAGTPIELYSFREGSELYIAFVVG